MISFCGLQCDTCPILVATMETDASRQQALRMDIVRICTEQYGMKLELSDVTDCDGCRLSGRLFSGCFNCSIRPCAMERNIENCAFCNDYPCEKLKEFFKNDPEAKIRLENIRLSHS